MTVRIYLLGSVSVEADGRLLIAERDLPGRVGRLAAAYLALERHRPIPREELAQVIWGQNRPDTWERELTDAVSGLGALVESVGFDGHQAFELMMGASYQVPFGEDVWIDAQAAINSLEAAKGALRQGDLQSAWLRGNVAAGIAARPLLPGEQGDWVEAQRMRLLETRIEGLEIVGQAAMALGDLPVVISVGRQVLALDPFRDSAHERLIRAFGASGALMQAADIFDRYKQVLASRGLAPSQEVINTYEQAIPATAHSKPARLVTTFMFTDIVDSTRLIDLIGDEAWVDLSRWVDGLLRSCFKDLRGEEVDHPGDGFLVSFSNQHDALSCAIEIQRQLDEHRRTHGFAPKVRIGLHTAEADKQKGRYTGKGLHEAARIGALAKGDAIVASRATVEGLSGFVTSNARVVELKGIPEPIEVLDVSWSKRRAAV
jgi:class 3 adenylate cyclase